MEPRDTYLETLVPRSTDAAGLSRLPGGREAYAYRLRDFTTTNLTADEIHALGLKQVALLEGEMDTILQGMGRTTGTVQSRIEQLEREQAYPLTEEGRAAIMAEAERMLRDAEQRASFSSITVQKRPSSSKPIRVSARPMPPPATRDRRRTVAPRCHSVTAAPRKDDEVRSAHADVSRGRAGTSFQIAERREHGAAGYRQINAFGGNAAYPRMGPVRRAARGRGRLVQGDQSAASASSMPSCSARDGSSWTPACTRANGRASRPSITG